MISLAVAVPPGLWMRNTTALTERSLAALSSWARTRATVLSCSPKPRRVGRAVSLNTPSISMSAIFGPRSPSTTVSRNSPGLPPSTSMVMQPAQVRTRRKTLACRRRRIRSIDRRRDMAVACLRSHQLTLWVLSPLALHVFQQLLQRQVCQRADRQVGMRERQLTRQGVRYGDAEQPSTLGGRDAIG